MMCMRINIIGRNIEVTPGLKAAIDDKIGKLQKRLEPKNIRLEIEPEAHAALLKEGFSQEYGAREIERVLNSRITPLLMREILFGRKEGFTAVISLEGNDFSIR